MAHRKVVLCLLGATLAASLFSGCSGKKSDPVTVTVWTYYNGDQLDTFKDLTEKFNDTVGKKDGITVETKSLGTAEDLEQNVLAAADGEVGASEVPNIFSAYSDTAYTMDQKDMLVDLSGYLTDKEKSEYVDFIRAVTPIIVDMFELILKKQCGIKIDDFCDKYKKNGKTIRVWSMKKLKDTNVGDTLNSLYIGGFKEKNIYSSHLKGLIEEYSEDTHLIQLVKNIRSVEANIRNLAAHEIVSVTDITIKELTGFTAGKIMGMIQELFGYTGISIKEDYWNSYDKMNNMILERM